MAKDKLDKKTLGFLERLEFGQVEKDWNIPAEYPNLSGSAEIALDLETCDPNLTTLGPGWTRNDGFIVGIAIATGDQQWYFPIRHKNGHNLDPKMTMRWLAKLLSREDLTVVMHNATYDAGWLRAEGVEVKGRIIDTMIAAPLIDENRFSYSLNNLGRDYIDMRKDERMLRAAAKDWGIDPKKDMWQLPAQYVGSYAEQDAAMTLALWRNLQTHITKEELGSIFALETGLIPLMLEMKARGVRVDLDKADIARKGLRTKVKELKAFIKDKTGVAIEPWAAASVQQVFEALNLQYPKTEAGAPSFTKQFLNAHPHQIARAIVRLREFDKADGTFIETILQHEHNGRIHCEFHQLRSDDGGTVTGRFCVSADTMIETQRGPVPIVEIKPRKDFALTHRGRLQSIRHLIYKGEEEMVALRVSSGNVVKCTRNHRVLTTAGWKRVGELSVGQEIASVDFEEGLGGRQFVSEGGGVVSLTGEADAQTGGFGAVYQLSHRAGDDEARSFKGAPQGGAGASVLPFENGYEEPNEGEDRRAASQSLGASVLRSSRVRSYSQAELVHGQAGVQARIRASGGYGADAWADGSSEWDGRASHRRGSNEQSPGQLGSGHSSSTPHPTRTVTVEEIEPLGVAQVWDIEVETDHSYVAHGLIHHNSSSSPNLQQIPARDPELKALIRGLFVPEPGQQWGSFDYSSQEPRLLVHYAASMPDSMRGPVVDRIVNEYNAGDVDLHQMVADIAGITRKQAKAVNLGIMYGMGVEKLSNQLGVSKDEAKRIMTEHEEKVPFVRQLATTASKQAEKYGQIRTLLGRKCRFHLYEPAQWSAEYKKALPLEEARKEYGPIVRRAFTYKALNKLIQGSAADQTKKAMADCFAEGLIPTLTVHDELCFSVESQEQASRIQEIMETGVSLKVPSKVDAELGSNWGEVG